MNPSTGDTVTVTPTDGDEFPLILDDRVYPDRTVGQFDSGWYAFAPGTEDDADSPGWFVSWDGNVYGPDASDDLRDRIGVVRGMGHPAIVDADDRPVYVGSRVRVGTVHVWTVIQITDPDGDVDDEGRSIAIPPYVRLECDGETYSARTYYTGQGWWDDDAPFKCDDLEVVE